MAVFTVVSLLKRRTERWCWYRRIVLCKKEYWG